MYTLAVPIPTLLLRVLILLVAFYAFGEYGLRALQDGLRHREVVTLRVQDVARLSPGTWPVHLTGFTDGSFVYEAGGMFNTDDAGDPVEVNAIEYAFLDRPPAGTAAPAQVRVVVLDRRIRPTCHRSAGGCVGVGERTVAGLLHVGEGRVRDGSRDLLERGGAYRVAPDAASLVAGDTPAPLWLPVLVMLGSGLVIFLTAVTFVPGVRLW